MSIIEYILYTVLYFQGKLVQCLSVVCKIILEKGSCSRIPNIWSSMHKGTEGCLWAHC